MQKIYETTIVSRRVTYIVFFLSLSSSVEINFAIESSLQVHIPKLKVLLHYFVRFVGIQMFEPRWTKKEKKARRDHTDSNVSKDPKKKHKVIFS